MYIEEEKKEEKKEEKRTVENEEIILVCPYEVPSTTLSSLTTSFIADEIENFIRHIKFVRTPTQTRIFQPTPHYKLLRSRGEQNPDF